MIDRRGPRLFLSLFLPTAIAASCASAPARSVAPPPAGASAVAAALARDESFRAQPPTPEPPRPFAPPIPSLTTLPNGMGLLVLERHVTRLVVARLVASGSDPNERPRRARAPLVR